MILGLDDTGDGRPLVLIHGLATTRMIWRRVIGPLSDGRRVVAIDVPGFGDSPPAGAGFDLPEVADRVLAGLIEARIPEPFDVVGHSMGGAVALTLADRHPSAMGTLILAAPAGLRAFPHAAAQAFSRVSPHLIAMRRAAAPAAGTAWGRRLLLAGGVVDGAALSPADVRAMMDASRNATRIGPALAEVASADLRPLLARLDLPLGVIWGAKDRIVPVTGLDTILRTRPEALTERIPDAGHIAMMERPEAFTAAARRLLNGLDPNEKLVTLQQHLTPEDAS